MSFEPPRDLRPWARGWVEALGALFLLSGVIFFFAHNWKVMSPGLRFGSLEAGVLITAVGALFAGVRSRLGRHLLLASSVLTGVLLAVYGQVYQTGADAFEVYALWAGLILLWAIVARTAALWMLWIVVAQTAMLLFIGQVVVPDHLTEGWAMGFVGLSLFSLATLAVAESRSAPRGFRDLLALATVAWASLTPWLWIVDGLRDSDAIAAIGSLIWMAVVAGVIWFYTRRSRFAGVPVAVAILSVAVLCFSWIVSELSLRGNNGLELLVAGLSGIALFGGAAALIAWVYRVHGKASDPERERTPWIAKSAIGLGAWLSGGFLAAALFELLEDGPNAELVLLVAGIVVIALSILGGRQRRGLFVRQLAVALNIAGTAAVVFAMHDLVPRQDGPEISLLAVSIVAGFVYWLSKNSVQRYLSLSWVWILWIITAEYHSSTGWLLAGIVVAAALLAVGLSREWPRPYLWKPAINSAVSGLIGFLFVREVGWLSLDDRSLWVSAGIGLILALALSISIWRIDRALGIGAALILLILALIGAPGLVLGGGLGVLGRLRRVAFCEWAGVAIFAGFFIRFYYSLDLTLMTKSLLLIAIGLVLCLVRALAFRKPVLLATA